MKGLSKGAMPSVVGEFRVNQEYLQHLFAWVWGQLDWPDDRPSCPPNRPNIVRLIQEPTLGPSGNFGQRTRSVTYCWELKASALAQCCGDRKGSPAEHHEPHAFLLITRRIRSMSPSDKIALEQRTFLPLPTLPTSRRRVST